MFPKLSAATIALLAPALFLAVRPAQAAWPNQAGVNLPICTAAAAQVNPVIVADGVGGAIIAWVDQRGGTNDIYAQHALNSGVVDPAWPANGRALCTAANTQFSPTIVSDGAGGAIVAWQDLRGGNYDIYAQHVLASGAVDPAWPVNGRALCTAAFDQLLPAITLDGAGGAIVTWNDLRGGVTFDIYAQHVLASGAVDGAWPVDGRALCTAANSQTNPAIVSDGAGGAIVTWQDIRGGANYDIYAQHVLASGAVDAAWPLDGRALCLAASDQTRPTIVSDGFGGALVTWQDARAGTADIYAQHVQASGAADPTWPLDGRALCTAGGNQQIPTIVSDGTGGAIVTWQDLRGLNVDIYAHHVQATGAVDPAWPVDGRQLCAAAGDQVAPVIVSDGAAGAIVTWYDFRSLTQYDIYAQHVLASGAVDPLWPVDGRAMCTATGNQQVPVIASDGAGGAIVAWYDGRAGAPYDIYAQRVARFGYLGTPEAEITGVSDVPNDNGGRVKLSWNASYLDLNSDPNLAWYEVYRSVPPNLVAEAAARGVPVLRSFADAPPPDGEMFIVDQAQYSWEYLTTQNALHYLPSYSYLAATAEDSTSYQNPKTAFMIVARNSSGSIYWLSRPDTGYSVDNLPPLAPAPFAGTYSSGVASLHWRPNSEIDLANYRLYRGSSPGFTPSPGNRIATPTDTLYDDAAGNTYYYKLSAVDIHGNESGFTLLLPDGALDVPGAAVHALSLSRPAPNPALESVSFALSLPRESRASVAIYDAAGRRVRLLAEGAWPAGERRFEWNLRDDSGRAVRSGLYFVRVLVDGRELTARLVTIR